MTFPKPREPAPTPVGAGPRGHLRGHHIFWSLLAGLIIVAVAIAVSWLIARPADHESWADVIRSAVLAAGAVAAVPAGYVAYRKQQTTEAERHEAIDKEQRRRDELVEADTRADAKDYRDRYAAASGQLGNDKAAIRLAGVYALAQLADEWGRTEPDQRQVCIDVLCAYLRMPWPAPPADPPAGRRLAGHTSAAPTPRPPSSPREASEETQVRATILRVAADHLRRDQSMATGWWRNDFDLRGAERLPECQFALAHLDGTFDVRGATFSRAARFEGATFSRAARFEGATFFEAAGFEGATFFEAAGFEGATFSGGATFADAKFSGDAQFTDARFPGDAEFTGATFSGDAWFRATTFSGTAEFGSAAFSRRANFVTAKFSREAEFGAATFSQGAWFGSAKFFGDAWFGSAKFSGDAEFEAAKFSGDAEFECTKFFGDATFGDAMVVGEVTRPDGTSDPATSTPRPIQQALFPEA